MGAVYTRGTVVREVVSGSVSVVVVNVDCTLVEADGVRVDPGEAFPSVVLVDELIVEANVSVEVDIDREGSVVGNELLEA